MKKSEYKTRYFMFSVFMVFFLSNSYSHSVQALMWPLKFALLGIFAFYINYSVRRKGLYINRYLPGYAYFLILCFAIFGMFSLYTYDGMFSHVVSLSTSHGYKLLIGFLLVTLFAIPLSRFLSVENSQQSFYFAMIYSAAIVTYSNMVLYLLGVNLGRGAGVIGGSGGVGRFSGWLDNPNTLGVILMGTFPVLLMSTLKKQDNRKKRSLLNFNNVLLFSMLFLLIMTGSRSSLLGVVVMAAIIFYTHSKQYRYLVIVVALVAGLFIFNAPDALNETVEVSQFQRQGEDYLSGRTDAWEIGRRLFEKEPYFGYGMGSEAVLLDFLLPENSVHQGNNFHNSFLSLLVIAGIVGALPLFILILVGVIKAIRIIINSSSHDRFTILMTSMFFGFLFHAFFESWLFSPGSAYGFMFWVTCFWLLSRERKRVFFRKTMLPRKEVYIR